MSVRIRDILDQYHITKRDQIVLVYNDEYIDSDEVFTLEKNNLRLYGLSRLQYNVSRHVFVPKHESISLYHRNRMLKEYRVKKHNLPTILFSDPQVRYHGFTVGTVIKVTRNQAHRVKVISIDI